MCEETRTYLQGPERALESAGMTSVFLRFGDSCRICSVEAATITLLVTAGDLYFGPESLLVYCVTIIFQGFPVFHFV